MLWADKLVFGDGSKRGALPSLSPPLVLTKVIALTHSFSSLSSPISEKSEGKLPQFSADTFHTSKDLYSYFSVTCVFAGLSIHSFFVGRMLGGLSFSFFLFSKLSLPISSIEYLVLIASLICILTLLPPITLIPRRPGLRCHVSTSSFLPPPQSNGHVRDRDSAVEDGDSEKRLLHTHLPLCLLHAPGDVRVACWRGHCAVAFLLRCVRVCVCVISSQSLVRNQLTSSLSGLLEAISGGVFLYISTFHLLSEELSNPKYRSAKLVLFTGKRKEA